VLDLAERGLNQCEIARETGIPRSTIRHWIRGETPKEGGPLRECVRCPGPRPGFWELTHHAYAYLLGLYLGDGSIATHRRGVFRLRIACFEGYPRIIEECAAAMSLVMPANAVSLHRRNDSRVIEVSSYSRHWPCVFPQHGAGRKHQRHIVLTEWQRRICDRFPGRLLRGLIHSDGYRGTNTIRHPKKTYRYPRYQFSNRSADIRAIFCEYCDKLGIESRQMNRWNISINRRESVAKMDWFVGPKQ
jgi:Homeodomain-like domain